MKLQGRPWRWAVFCGVLTVFAGGGTGVWLTLPQSASAGIEDNSSYPAALRSQFAAAVKAVTMLESRQTNEKTELVSPHTLQLELAQAQIDAASGQFREAMADIKSLTTQVKNFQLELEGGTIGAADMISADTPSSVFLPILFYHYTPPDFDAQLTNLEQKDYTVVTMAQALAGLEGGPLPKKPVVITFDDGFANQMDAYQILKAHHMKATFYIIDGGPDSKWCIGAGRKYGDPSQPASGCGDAYLNWDQVRMLDKSGLITIGGHTIDHPNLASETLSQQEYEIVQGKQELEQELGHPVQDFAYPYGSYNASTLQIVEEAGYETAVTTQPSDYQAPGYQYTLSRIRDAWELP